MATVRLSVTWAGERHPATPAAVPITAPPIVSLYEAMMRAGASCQPDEDGGERDRQDAHGQRDGDGRSSGAGQEWTRMTLANSTLSRPPLPVVRKL